MAPSLIGLEVAQTMKNMHNEAELVVEAQRVGANYTKSRGVGEFEATDSAKDKVTFLYRLLVRDKLIQPLARGEDSAPNMKHKLALWMARQLPQDHPLLKE
jgi:hypothetical protein